MKEKNFGQPPFEEVHVEETEEDIKALLEMQGEEVGEVITEEKRRKRKAAADKALKEGHEEFVVGQGRIRFKK